MQNVFVKTRDPVQWGPNNEREGWDKPGTLLNIQTCC